MTFPLSKILDKPDVASAAALLAERVANHVLAEQHAYDSARYHEYADEVAGELVDGVLRHGEVESYRDWAEGYELDERVAGL